MANVAPVDETKETELTHPLSIELETLLTYFKVNFATVNHAM